MSREGEQDTAARGGCRWFHLPQPRRGGRLYRGADSLLEHFPGVYRTLEAEGGLGYRFYAVIRVRSLCEGARMVSESGVDVGCVFPSGRLTEDGWAGLSLPPGYAIVAADRKKWLWRAMKRARCHRVAAAQGSDTP